jgi:outer membrane protein assembly factor BamB
MDVRSGQPAWSYTVGGRVDSPPTISRGRVLFGSADGWVYCLRAADGRLAWRFRAAPQEQRVMAHDQLESAWPVSGSVLVANETVYCVAGRSAFLDGGLRLLRLEPQTGRLLSETRIDDRDPESGQHLQSLMKGQDLPVALPDILSCDGHTVYMRTQAFDLEGQRRHVGPLKLDNRARRRGEAPAEDEAAEIRPHLFARSGFLDDSWFFRSYWLFGTAIDSNYGGWLRPGHFAPSGRLMAFDDQRVYSFDRQPQYLCNASVQEYYLYAADREVTAAGLQRLQAWTNRINAASTDKGASSSDWATRKKFSLTENNAYQYHWAQGNPPIQARGLVLAGQTLAVAGPPDVVDEEAAFRAPDDPAIREKLAAQAAALQGRLGGQLLVVSATDGQTLAAYELGTVPTFDGLVAAQGCLYLTTLDGRLLCLGSTGTPLAPAAPPKLVALDTSIREIPEEPVPARGPSLAGEFSEVARAEVTRGELGYHVRSESKTPGLVLQKLPTPLTGKVQLKARMKVATDGQLKNGFVVFGESPDEATLVKCGLRYAMKKAVIVQGPLSGDKVAAQPFEPDESRVYDLAITVDVSSGAVTLQAAGTTVTATLDRPPSKIAWIGYAVLNAAAEFSPIDSAP